MGLLVLPTISFAQDGYFGGLSSGGNLGVRQLRPVNIINVLNNIINWMFAILLVVAVIYIIIAAYYFVIAQGDSGKVEKGRHMVIYALIGVLIAFVAKGLIALVEQIVSSS